MGDDGDEGGVMMRVEMVGEGENAMVVMRVGVGVKLE